LSQKGKILIGFLSLGNVNFTIEIGGNKLCEYDLHNNEFIYAYKNKSIVPICNLFYHEFLCILRNNVPELPVNVLCLWADHSETCIEEVINKSIVYKNLVNPELMDCVICSGMVGIYPEPKTIDQVKFGVVTNKFNEILIMPQID
jgi:hypothetical protein